MVNLLREERQRLKEQLDTISCDGPPPTVTNPPGTTTTTNGTKS